MATSSKKLLVWRPFLPSFLLLFVWPCGRRWPLSGGEGLGSSEDLALLRAPTAGDHSMHRSIPGAGSPGCALGSPRFSQKGLDAVQEDSDGGRAFVECLG